MRIHINVSAFHLCKFFEAQKSTFGEHSPFTPSTMVEYTFDDSVSPLVIFFVNVALYLRDVGKRVAGKIHSMESHEDFAFLC